MNTSPSFSPLADHSFREPPHNIRAEQSLLGAVLTNNKAFYAVAEFLRPEHFIDHVHAMIFREVGRRLFQGGHEVVDPLSLKVWFESQPEATEVNGQVYLAQLLGAMVGIVNAKEYGKAIFDAWVRREVIAQANALLTSAYGGDDAFEKAAVASASRIEQIVSGIRPGSHGALIGDFSDQVLARAEAAYKHGGPMGALTGFPTIDRAIAGLDPETFTVLGARPGMGKTALAIQIALNRAREALRLYQDRKMPTIEGVVVFSMEMSGVALTRRVMAAMAGLSVTQVRLGEINLEWNALIEAGRALKGIPLKIVDARGLSPALMTMHARRARREMGGLSLVIADHIQITRPDEAPGQRLNGRTEAMTAISGGFVDMCKALKVPVMALAQLSRKIEDREDKRPNLADLRESGAIEQDADNVLFLHREDYYLLRGGDPKRNGGESVEHWQARILAYHEEVDGVKGKAELILAKTREGEGNKAIHLNWNGPRMEFSEPTGAAVETEVEF